VGGAAGAAIAGSAGSGSGADAAAGAGGAGRVDAAAPDVAPPKPPGIPTAYPTGPGPANVQVGPGGRLVYLPDKNGDTIPDFSNCGYGGGGVAIPDVPVVTTLSPVAAEANAQPRLQAAIDALAAKPLDDGGFRGAILLTRGIYPIAPGLKIPASGIVLRGEGDGPDGTVLRLVGAGAPVFQIDGTGSARELPDTRRNLVDPYVPVGARWFRVDSTQGLAVGDTIKVVRPSTEGWIAALDMAQYGWAAGGYDMRFDRVITAIQEDRILVDAPIVQGIDKNFGGGYLYKYTYPERLENIGLEGMRGESTQDVDEIGNTGGNLLRMTNVQNAWIRRLTNNKMRGAAVRIGGSSKWITVEDTTSFHNPLLGPHRGASPSVFTFENGVQLVLFQRLTSNDGGFEFSSGARNPGPNVYTDSDVPHGFAFSGPHHRWANATLYDDLRMAHGLHVRNAKDQGSGHGWQGANHVFWNVVASSFTCERPPTTQQWNIGGVANSMAGDCTFISFGKHVEPKNLYRAQLAERLGPAALQAISRRPE